MIEVQITCITKSPELNNNLQLSFHYWVLQFSWSFWEVEVLLLAHELGCPTVVSHPWMPHRPIWRHDCRSQATKNRENNGSLENLKHITDVERFYPPLSRMETSIISAVRVSIGFGDELDDTLAAETHNRNPMSFDSCLATTRGRETQPIGHYANRERWDEGK